MTIDERLDRLTERHEALTQSVELLALQGQQTYRRIDALANRIEALLRIAEIREHRLNGLEGA